ncbi:MAG: carboxypeptidase M32 [Solirubrobacteraceae bacterium]
MSAAPPELVALRERAAVLCDLDRIGALLFWDQNTMMPPNGATARGDHAATLQTVAHERITDPGLVRLLDVLEPWAAGEDPDADDVRLIRELRRDVEKAIRVPTSLAAEMSRAAALGQAAWEAARAAADYGRFRDALARHLELRHRYVECFTGYEHPYDVLLDDFEPEMTTARLRPLFASLREALVPLVEATAGPLVLPFGGEVDVESQRRAVMMVLEGVGFDPDGWRLDVAPHPFAQALGRGDVRVTTRYDLHDFAGAYFGALHEFGHGLYEAQIPERLGRSPLGSPVSLGVHESQSRLWENLVGRSRAFCTWVAPQLSAILPGFDDIDADELYRRVNTVHRNLIRVEADETTYNLHIVLRFELELGLVEGRLGVDDLPHAWNQGMHELLGLDVPDDAQGLLQDVHWGAGMVGYFPTYTLGNLMAAQLWETLSEEVPDVEAAIERGDFAPLREWLGRRIHAEGRRLPPPELLRRVTGQELAVEPFIRYLRGKLAGVGVLPPT